MNQCERNYAVASVTGESATTIKRLGFHLVEPVDLIGDPNAVSRGPHVVDWDERELAFDFPLIQERHRVRC